MSGVLFKGSCEHGVPLFDRCAICSPILRHAGEEIFGEVVDFGGEGVVAAGGFLSGAAHQPGDGDALGSASADLSGEEMFDDGQREATGSAGLCGFSVHYQSSFGGGR